MVSVARWHSDYADALRWYRVRRTKGSRLPRSPWGGSTGAAWASSAIRRGDGLVSPRRGAWQSRGPMGDRNFYQFGDEWPRIYCRRGSGMSARLSGFRFGRGPLGLLYEHGNGVPKDYPRRCTGSARRPMREIRWRSTIGHFLSQRWAVPQDYDRPCDCVRQAADKGSPVAAFNIGLLYANGHGVKADRQQARAWFEKAAAAGNEQAIDRLAQIDRECNAVMVRSGYKRAPVRRRGTRLRENARRDGGAEETRW